MRPSSRVDMSGLCDDADRGIPEFPAWDSQINNYSKSSLRHNDFGYKKRLTSFIAEG